jgi:hypothetical protein
MLGHGAAGDGVIGEMSQPVLVSCGLYGMGSPGLIVTGFQYSSLELPMISGYAQALDSSCNYLKIETVGFNNHTCLRI